MVAETELAILIRVRDQLSKDLDKANKKVKKFGGEAEDATKKANKGFEKLNRKLIQFVAGFAAFRILRTAIDNAIEFRLAMSEVSTIVDTSVVNMERMGDAVRDLAVAQNANQEIVAKGLYQTISAGVSDAGDALNVLGVAGKLAKAGVAETTDTVRLLTGALNAFQLPIEDAGRLSDIFFKTVELGQTTIAEMSSSMGKLFPLASQLGVGVNELSAAVASLTKGGLGTAEAVTALQGAMVAFLKKGEDANKLFGEGTDLMGSQAIKAKGLRDAFVDLAKATGGDADALVGLIGRVEGANAILALSGNLLEDFDTNLRKVADSAGATGEAFDKRMKDPAERVTAALNGAKIGMSELGEESVLQLAKILEGFGEGEDAAENFRRAILFLEPVFKVFGIFVAALVTGIEAVVVAIAELAVQMSRMAEFLGIVDMETTKLVESIRNDLGKSFLDMANITGDLIDDLIALGKEQDDSIARTRAAADAARENAARLRAMADAAEAAASAVKKLNDQTPKKVGPLPSGTRVDLDAIAAFDRQLEIMQSTGVERQKLMLRDRFLLEKQATDAEFFEKKRGQEDFELWLKARSTKLEIDLLQISKEGLARKQEEARRFNEQIIKDRLIVFQGADAFLGGATDALTDFAMGAKSAKEAFRDFSRQFLTDITRMIIQAQLLKFVMLSLNGFGIPAGAISQFFGTPFPSAQGNAFSGGQVVPFADGGVVTRPTMAPMALFGEAGPEAIMPLRRTPEGRLGIEATGTQGVTINLGFIDAEGADDWVFRRAEAIESIVLAALDSRPNFRAAVGGV